MRYNVKHGTKEQCEAWAAQVNALFPPNEWGAIAAATVYSPKYPNDYVFGVQHSPILCGWLGLNGFRHISDHGQGYNPTPIRTLQLERCEKRAQAWLDGRKEEVSRLQQEEDAEEESTEEEWDEG